MQNNQIDLVAFGPEHIEGAVLLSRAESWPHRHADWKLAQELSTGIAAVDADGRVVGTTLVTPYGRDCATINMVIVDKSMRGLGLGRKLMERAIALAEDRPLRLVATDEGLPLYEKLGFVANGQIRQHQGEVRPVVCPDGVEDMQPGDLDDLKALDKEAHGADRSALIDALVERGEIAVIRKGKTIEAWAAIRPFGRGEVIGPVIAPDAKTACALIAYHASSRPAAFLRVDTGSETGIAPWLSEIGLSHVGGGTAMRRPAKEDAEQSRRKVYALANQALG
ncbi:GNAT family N-acetyltransferase [Rhizobium sp. PAMB 3174]